MDNCKYFEQLAHLSIFEDVLILDTLARINYLYKIDYHSVKSSELRKLISNTPFFPDAQMDCNFRI
ncbi:hypothetical protein Lbir_3072 [Legionella birminghamensis]|uniref:Uncharacterized protein n=1 Tax=Legionella birminghamensis TaxID=28083 RepID=A0A378ICK2_9GAMM|nr:hypothetical protein Lbir_3072 [Legionella birminghamensis]STX32919.1 Uncharacterised protein [Legionella birminghamensis]